MLAVLLSAGKKNDSTGGRVTDTLNDQKPSGFEQRTLLIKGFKYGLSLCFFVRKNNEGSNVKLANFQRVYVTPR